MIFRKPYSIISLFIISIVITSLLVAWAIVNENLRFSVYYFGILVVFEGFFLFRYIRKEMMQTEKFLGILIRKDSQVNFSEDKLSRSHKSLYKLMNEFASSLQDIQIEKEKEHHFFEQTLKHLNVGLLAFTDEGKIIKTNQAALKLFGLNHIVSIHSLDHVKEGFSESIQNLLPGHSLVTTIQPESNFIQLSVHVSEFKLGDQKISLASMQDIRNELQEEEIRTWQKLIRVLTHEIMNSIGPITSLSGSLLDCLTDLEKLPLNNQTKKESTHNMRIGLESISKRSEGLTRFVHSYRSLTKIPEPDLRHIEIKRLFDQIKSLKQQDLLANQVKLNTSVFPENLELLADEKLISQALINLINNAIQALNDTKKPEIRLKALIGSNNRTELHIINNGPEIPDELVDKIFIPFFTTRKDGSGIGLSLSSQIMQLHKGSIRLDRSIKGQTSFVLIF